MSHAWLLIVLESELKACHGGYPLKIYEFLVVFSSAFSVVPKIALLQNFTSIHYPCDSRFYLVVFDDEAEAEELVSGW